MTPMTKTAAPPIGDLFTGPQADRYIAEWVTGLSLLRRKMLRRREAMAPEGPAAAASIEALANVFQRLPPKCAAACRGVCLRWSVLLSSPRLAALADADADGSSTCFAGRDGVVGGACRDERQQRRRGGAVFSLPLLPKHQYRRSSRKKQEFRGMF